MKTATITSLQGPPIQVSANLKQTTNSESAFSKSRSEEITIQQTVQIPSRFTIHPPKSSYPLRTNPASSATIPSSSNSSNPPCLPQNYQSLTLLPCLLVLLPLEARKRPMPQNLLPLAQTYHLKKTPNLHPKPMLKKLEELLIDP